MPPVWPRVTGQRLAAPPPPQPTCTSGSRSTTPTRSAPGSSTSRSCSAAGRASSAAAARACSPVRRPSWCRAAAPTAPTSPTTTTPRKIERLAHAAHRRRVAVQKPRAARAAPSRPTGTASTSPGWSTARASSSTAPASPAAPAARCTSPRSTRGERPLDWKPDVCWQLPLRREDDDSDDERPRRHRPAVEAPHWGDGRRRVPLVVHRVARCVRRSPPRVRDDARRADRAGRRAHLPEVGRVPRRPSPPQGRADSPPHGALQERKAPEGVAFRRSWGEITKRTFRVENAALSRRR